MLGKSQRLKGITIKKGVASPIPEKLPLASLDVAALNKLPVHVVPVVPPASEEPVSFIMPGEEVKPQEKPYDPFNMFETTAAPAKQIAPPPTEDPFDLFEAPKQQEAAKPASYNPFNVFDSAQPAPTFKPEMPTEKVTTMPQVKRTITLKKKTPAIQEEYNPFATPPAASYDPFAVQAPLATETLPKKRTIQRRKQYGPQEEKYRSAREKEIKEDPYTLDESQTTFMPPTRLAFQQYMRTTFTPFAITEVPKPDFEACAKLGQRGEGVIERFLYQQFVREYMRQETPYRGLLVYHGLGSGKTCTSIAAAEALFGRANKKIIVMTPGSLRNNFKNELTSCGFRHHSLQNHWVFLPLTETIKQFASEVLGLNLSSKMFQDMASEPVEQHGIWIPDFDHPPNYSSLAAWQQTSIRRQLNSQLESRIKFLSYNSARDTSKSVLQAMVCPPKEDGEGFFDNAVIVIDEIHNLTRMMCRKMDKELLERIRRGDKDPAFDPITFESWKPAICTTPHMHSRAYLLYRLLATAKNSKIIGLSGTPLINFPEEIAILANLLGGYMHSVEATIPITPTAEADLLAAAKAHPRIDFIDVQKSELKVRMFYSIFPNKYKKVYSDTNEFKGIEYDEEATADPAQVHAELTATLKEKGIVLSAPLYKSYPLLPPTKDDFYKAFIRESDYALMNQPILRRRLQGLVSYYRGSKEDLMPRIKEDIIVQVPLGEYAYSKYFEARKEELKQASKSSVSKDIEELEDSMNPAYYRFRSRSACNFAFPSDIDRPYPGNKKAALIDTGPQIAAPVITETDAAPTQEDLMDQIMDEAVQAPGEEGTTAVVPQQTLQLNTYAEKLEEARRLLYERKDQVLKLTGDPNEGLEKFSPKMAAIIRKIEELDARSASPDHFIGPQLVYSQFITMEGLGILGMAMEANGYVPIELEGPVEDLRFTERTLESLAEGPARRFMFFTSNATAREREVLLNIFNGRFDKLPPKIKEVLETIFPDTKNLHGEICSVFGIGAAGAEGISLRNVRAVHIMEPYWNNVRTEQVKGRAVRICSHMELPLEERDVSVYTYCSVFQGKIDESLKISDGAKTSDEYINDIAKLKTAVNEGILTIMKETAVDCVLNQMENQDVRCFVPKASSTESFAYHPDIEYDLKNPPVDAVVPLPSAAATAKPQIVEIKGITNTEKAKAIAPSAALASAPMRPGVEKAPMVMVKGREYIMVPKPGSTDLFLLYDKSDTLKTRQLGLLKRDPLSGAFAVKMM
jgi:hypothetical protein